MTGDGLLAGRSGLRTALAAALVLGLAAAAAGVWQHNRPSTDWVLTESSAEVLQRMAAPLALEAPVDGAWRWVGLSVAPATATFVLSDGAQSVEVVLSHPNAPPASEEVAESENLRLAVAAEPPGSAAAAVTALTDRLRAADDRGAADGLWREVYSGEGRSDAVWSSLEGRLFVVYQFVWIVLAALLAGHALTTLGAARRAPLAAGYLVVLTALSVALRAALATGGPGDYWLNLTTGAGYVGFGASYGMAPNAWLWLTEPLSATLPDRILGTNLVFGSLTPLVGALFVFAVTARRTPAALTGLFLAVHPLLVRHGGEGHRQPYVLLLAVLALWSAARYLRGGPRRLLAVAALAALLCVQSRPEAVLLIPSLGLFALLGGDWKTPRRAWRPSRPILVIGLCGLLAAAWLAAQHLLMTSLDNTDPARIAYTLPHPDRHAWLHPQVTPLAIAALAVLGALLSLVHRHRLTLWAALSLFGMSLVVGHQSVTGTELELLNARYHTLTILFAIVAAAFALTQLATYARRLRPWAYPAVVGLGLGAVALTTWTPMQAVIPPRTVDLEYRFLLEHAPRLPEGAVVHIVQMNHDYGLKDLEVSIPHHLPAPQEWRPWQGEPPAPDRPAVYYHTAACHNADIRIYHRSICERGLERYGAHPIFEATLPARPISVEHYEGDEVVVGFYEMKEGE